MTAHSIDPAGAVPAAVTATAAWLDWHNGIGGTEIGLRVAKVAEEAGEAVGAWIGLVGHNPRKGVTHTDTDVAAELADVVLAALVAIRSLGRDPAAVLGQRVRTVVDRIHESESHPC
jgi:NTP pyrophosphatase (non-canonical NTP hydrolase)